MTTRTFDFRLSAFGFRFLHAIGVLATLAVIVAPLVALMVGVAGDPGATGLSPTDAGMSPRHWSLLFRTLGLAAAAALLAMVLAIPGAYAVGRIGRASSAPISTALIAMPLLLPPMVVAFGWQRVLGPYTPGLETWSQYGRCVWIWASWAWPIPAVIVGSSWSRIGRPAYEAAVLEANPISAFRRAVLPALRRHVCAAALTLAIIFLGEYTVPHANGLVVVATDLLTSAQSATPSAVIRQSLPLVTVLLVLIASVYLAWPKHLAADAELHRPGDQCRSKKTLPAVIAVVAPTLIFPIGALAARSDVASEIAEAIATYGGELAGSIGVCLAAGVLTAFIGTAVMTATRFRSTLIGVVFVIGIAPGALVGEGVLLAYQRIWWVYDYWPILVIALAARYAWVGVLSAWLAASSGSAGLIAQASVDGADRLTARLAVQWPHQWPVLLAGIFIAAAMALADVDVVAIVQVPSPHMVAAILIEKFHRFETGMLAALSLLMVASVVPGAILLAAILKWRD